MKIFLFLITLVVSTSALSNKHVTVFIEEKEPYISIKDNKIKGISIGILNTLFERAGIVYELKRRPFKRSYETVLGRTNESQSNQCLFPMQATQENAALFSWIGPVMVTESGFFAKKGKVIRSIADIKESRVGSYIGSVDGENLQSLGVNVEYTRNTRLNAKKVEADRLVFFVEDTKAAELILNKNNLREIEMVYPYKKYLNSMACSLDLPKSTIEKLESSLISLYLDGSIGRLINSM
ncbi:hypothetical protein BZJ19_15835 [Salinivibrio proteolyticus]|uniref:substrate-binding periplasmic protein n=1 Tax=Salinivibrio proteolyticus TaxID=334715 RepID=UPI000988ADED|nr:transporter substrate-binding domain-containing protein [Salinivibrio proteolyticus]OOF21775.1 hypothetical protein BZJ19_15835 [Salinivibrio proteolyticus]